MPYKLLLVDDDTEFRSEFRECLNEYNVVEAPNGEEALKILKRPNEIDLVLLDVRMPGKTGTEILKEMKAISPDLGIIILTGHSSEDVAIESLKGRADDYLEKPLDIDATKETIEKLLESRFAKNGIVAGDAASKVERAKRFAERNCYKKVCLNDAARAVSLSPKYLSRIFKELTGTGFSEYRLTVKTQEAKNILKDTNFNIDQIGDRLGYQNTESFIRVFKKMIGMTPTEYRRSTVADRKRKKKMQK